VSQLVTGEAVALDLRPAALPSRVVAALVDAVAQFALLAVVGGVATAVSLDVSDAGAAALGLLVLALVLVVYPVTFETLLRGRTPGKAALGLRVVRDDGGPIGFRQALVRGLAGGFLERPGLTLFLGAVVSMLLSEQSKRLGDLLAGTVVVRERVAARGGAMATMPPQLEGWAAGLDLSRLPDALALSARQFVARADELTDQAREDLGGRLVRAVIEAVGPPPPGTPGWAVLSAVLAERRRREHERLSGVPAPERTGSAPSAPVAAAPLPTASAPAAAVRAGRGDDPASPAPGSGGFVAPS
jgi:uncharacterized RDD family membrane protein YckC